MLGAIIGDIVGSSYEFDNIDTYDFPLFNVDKDFTDDTICTVAVADAILSDKDYQSCMRFWCRKYPNPMGAYGSFFLNWIMRPDPHPYNSFGNGSAMRVSPVAWLFSTEKDVRTQARASAAITHNHPEGLRGAEAIAVAIFRMRIAPVKDASLYDSVAREFYGDNYIKSLPPRGFFDVTCMGCVPLALYLASTADSFEDAIRKGVAYGGDTDTVGAIIGSLAEACFGIPTPIREKALQYLPDDMLRVLSRFEATQKGLQ